MRDKLLKSSEQRLWDLIAERTRPGVDLKALDQRIWDLFGETWAVMFTDLSGFSRQVEKFGILHFLQIIHEHKKLLSPIIHRHDGILIKIEADSLIVIFRRTASAVRCAVEMQKTLQEFNRTRPPETEILLCVGIGYGEMLRIGDLDVFGREVNAASKLGEDTAKAGEILLTKAAVDSAGAMDGVTFEKVDAQVGRLGGELPGRVLRRRHAARAPNGHTRGFRARQRAHGCPVWVVTPRGAAGRRVGDRDVRAFAFDAFAVVTPQDADREGAGVLRGEDVDRGIADEGGFSTARHPLSRRASAGLRGRACCVLRSSPPMTPMKRPSRPRSVTIARLILAGLVGENGDRRARAHRVERVAHTRIEQRRLDQARAIDRQEAVEDEVDIGSRLAECGAGNARSTDARRRPRNRAPSPSAASRASPYRSTRAAFTDDAMSPIESTRVPSRSKTTSRSAASRRRALLLARVARRR